MVSFRNLLFIFWHKIFFFLIQQKVLLDRLHCNTLLELFLKKFHGYCEIYHYNNSLCISSFNIFLTNSFLKLKINFFIKILKIFCIYNFYVFFINKFVFSPFYNLKLWHSESFSQTPAVFILFLLIGNRIIFPILIWQHCYNYSFLTIFLRRLKS